MADALQLAVVDLSNNQLTGALPALPPSIELADMSGNLFGGSIPISYGALSAHST
jgi:hypothetical protein